MVRRIEFTVGEEFYARVERARGSVPRAAFVKRALEAALGAGSEGAGDSQLSSVAVSPRAPGVEAGASFRHGPRRPQRGPAPKGRKA